MTDTKPLEERLVAFLEQLSTSTQSRDKGNLAALRRSLARPPGEDPATFPVLGRFMRDGVLKHDERMMFLIAGLYAAHPQHDGHVGGFGSTFAKMKANDSAELRFKRLLLLERDELPVPMRRAVMLAKAKSLSINYICLFRDLARWHPSGSVQRDWARQFWNAQKSDSAENIDEITTN